MIADLKPYPEYKDSGSPWLGIVPGHWEMRRTKTLLRERVSKGFPCEPMLAATQTKGVVRKGEYENRTVLAIKDLHLLKLVKAGDFVISLRSFQGGIEYAREQGIISPAYTILYPINQEHHGFLAKLFKSQSFIENLTLYVTGIRQGQNIDYEKLSRSQIPIPPPAEQSAIVRFLNWANDRLDRAIRAKRKTIALLNEQKQAIIHRAVTRGLDPNAHLKDSSIPWIGKIPAHWEVQRLGRAMRLITGFPFASGEFTHSENDVRLLRGINVTPTGVRWDAVVRWSRKPGDDLDEFLLQVGDIVLGMDRPIVASGVRATTVEEQDTPSLLLQRVARLLPTDRLNAKFLLLLLHGRFFKEYIAPIFTGVSVPHLSPEQIKGFKVMLPPIQEQQTIVAFTDSETGSLNTAITRLEREIDLLREYRTRLTADIVTGKLDVREAAETLPDTPMGSPEPAPLENQNEDEVFSDALA